MTLTTQLIGSDPLLNTTYQAECCLFKHLSPSLLISVLLLDNGSLYPDKPGSLKVPLVTPAD